MKKKNIFKKNVHMRRNDIFGISTSVHTNIIFISLLFSFNNPTNLRFSFGHKSCNKEEIQLKPDQFSAFTKVFFK